MKKEQFKQGQDWALRKQQQPLGILAQRVKLLLYVDRSKGRDSRVKVRMVDGDLAGLEEFVSPKYLLCPWSEWKDVLRDEQRELALLEHLKTRDQPDGVTVEAANTALGASGEDIYLDMRRGYTRVYSSGALERLAERCGMQERPWKRPPCFRDSKGSEFALNEDLVRLAVLFAEAEPQLVQMSIDGSESQYRAEGYIPGQRYMHDMLVKYSPAWALARHWAGGNRERDNLRDEIQRLRGLVEGAASSLRAKGDDAEASRLERAIRGK